MIEVYKGRKLKVREKPGEFGRLESYVNGVLVHSPIALPTEIDKCLAQLRRDVDAADQRRLTEPTAFGAYWYEGAPHLPGSAE